MKPSQKIVHVISYFQHQFGYQEYFLARDMATMGHEVHVITSDRYAPVPDYDRVFRPVLGDRIIGPQTEQVEGFTVHRLPTVIEHRTRVFVSGMGKLLDQIRPDVVILHGTTNLLNMVPILKKFQLGYRLILDDHMLFKVWDSSLLGRLYYWLWGTVLKPMVYSKRAAIVGVADECVEFVSVAFNIPMEYLHNIPLGADHRRFYPDPAIRKAMREELGYTAEDIVVVYTGKMSFDKDPALLAEAGIPLTETLPLKFLFVGNIDETYQARYLQAGGDHASVKNVPAVPNTELFKYYNAADIACWPKATSLSMIEAASTGVPIVVSKNMTERLAYNNGIGITQCNLPEIRDALRQLASDPELRNEMGKRGRQLVEDKLSYQALSNRFLEVAEGLI